MLFRDILASYFKNHLEFMNSKLLWNKGWCFADRAYQ